MMYQDWELPLLNWDTGVQQNQVYGVYQAEEIWRMSEQEGHRINTKLLHGYLAYEDAILLFQLPRPD